jgi:hypothetical protein
LIFFSLFFAFDHLIFFTMPAIPVHTSGNPSNGVSPMDAPPSNFMPSAVEFSVEFSSPFYLHHGDSPGTLLISQPLIGINYHTWKRSMTMALSAKNKLCFIDGSLMKPSVDAPEFAAWNRCNNMVLSWILNSVSQEIASSIIYIESA